MELASVGIVPFVGEELQFMIEDCSLIRARQVPIAMVCKIHDGWFVGGRRVINFQFVLIR